MIKVKKIILGTIVLMFPFSILAKESTSSFRLIEYSQALEMQKEKPNNHSA